jgi:hypothetical protein
MHTEIRGWMTVIFLELVAIGHLSNVVFLLSLMRFGLNPKGHDNRPEGAMKLLPVRISAEQEPQKLEAPPGHSIAIHIELPGQVRIGLDGTVDPAIVRAVLQSLRP